MDHTQSRTLRSHGLTEAEWAVLFTASYYTPFPRETVIEMAGLELTGTNVVPRVLAGLRSCLRRGFMETCRIRSVWSSCEDQCVPGLVLSETGLALKEAVGSEVMVACQ